MKHKAGHVSGSSYRGFLKSLVGLLEEARRFSARSVNAVMTATYWEIGRRIVEFEQGGKGRAGYGEAVLQRLSADLTSKYGRGFSERNLRQMRLFFLAWPIRQTVSAESPVSAVRQLGPQKLQTLSAESSRTPTLFPLPWSLKTVKKSQNLNSEKVIPLEKASLL